MAIDTGGTFTDCVYFDGGEIKVAKVPSTPADPSLAIVEALRLMGVTDALDLCHGTTVGTNTLLEKKGALVAFVTTAGFEDTIAIGRQTRESLYDWFAPVPVCVVPRALRFGVPERVSAEGPILRRPSDEELATLVEQVRRSGAEAIAISLLFSFANPETERRVEAALRCLGLPLSVSHRVLPEFREYERGATTVANAYLAPRMQAYLLRLQERVTASYKETRVSVMQSSGGTVSVKLAAEEPVRTVLSGPAGGVIGASRLALMAGFERIIGFDMGGTSTDVFLADARSGGLSKTRESIVGGLPIGVPMLDIHTVGAGGGSLARFDRGGMLRVGPESAGAEPGPICNGRGTVATVTDANLLLGRLDAESFLQGEVRLDRERTRRMMDEQRGTIATVEEFAAGIVRVIEAQMARAIRVVSMERGFDPREFALVAFGGGGPLHACALARALRIPKVIVPMLPGALSAVGILLADAVREYSQTVMLPAERGEGIRALFQTMTRRAVSDFAAEGLHGNAEQTLDLRYRGQGYELNVPYHGDGLDGSVTAFHDAHRRRYGFASETKAVEVVNVRVRMVAAGERYAPASREPVPGDGRAAYVGSREIFFEGGPISSGFYRRSDLVAGDIITGPALITEYTSATALPPRCIANVDGLGNLVISIPAQQGGSR